MNFEFATAARIRFGAGVLKEVGPGARHLGQRALVVTGSHPQRAQKLLALLAENGVTATTFAVAGEPEIATIDAGVAAGRQADCELVIAFGGGSVIDAGKAIAVMLTNQGQLLDYLEVVGGGKSLARKPRSLVAIPTTAGTGAEVTRNAVIGSPEHKVKVSLRSAWLLPFMALIDPELTYDLPPALTASTGLDALTQLIEPYVCLRANPLTDGYCLDGLHRAGRSLREAVFGGLNKFAREDLALASLYGGLSLANAGLGAVHGFAGPIGGMFPAPHGAVCGALLPHVMAANLRALRERDARSYALGRYYRIAAILTGNPHATADAGVEWVRELVAGLPIPTLGTYGLREEHLPDLVAKAAKASSMKANPIVLPPEELAEILRNAL